MLAVEARPKQAADVLAGVGARLQARLQLVPSEIVLVPHGSLPKTSSGKPQRSKTRSAYLDGTIERLES